MAIVLSKSIQVELEKVATVASYLWERQWIERNGGNISINLTGLISNLQASSEKYPFIPASVPAGSGGILLFITGSGERLRDLPSNMENVACIVHVDDREEGYRILWGGRGGASFFRPSSELAAHLMIHLEEQQTEGMNRAVLHVHPTELISLSHHPVFGHDEEEFNRACWSMLPEVRLFIPKGIGLVPFAVPGSDELAVLTAKKLKKRDVALWSKHGAVAMGKDIFEAFDYIDVANKGAAIYLQCLAAGFVPEGMSDTDMNRLMELI